MRSLAQRLGSIPLLGVASEEPEDNAGGSPIVVLMNIGAERGPVVVDIEQADVEVPGWVYFPMWPERPASLLHVTFPFAALSHGPRFFKLNIATLLRRLAEICAGRCAPCVECARGFLV